jgi:hypothetical protein
MGAVYRQGGEEGVGDLFIKKKKIWFFNRTSEWGARPSQQRTLGICHIILTGGFNILEIVSIRSSFAQIVKNYLW